jgi:hypothetical protein
MEDILHGLYVASSFVSGLTGVEPVAVAAGSLALMGAAAAPAAKLAGRCLRSGWRVAYRCGKWAFVKPENGPECEAVLKALGGMALLSRAGDFCHVAAGGVVAVVDDRDGELTQLKAGDHPMLSLLTVRETRLVARKVNEVLARLKAEDRELRRIAVLEALSGKVVKLDEVPLVARSRPGVPH